MCFSDYQIDLLLLPLPVTNKRREKAENFTGSVSYLAELVWLFHLQRQIDRPTLTVMSALLNSESINGAATDGFLNCQKKQGVGKRQNMKREGKEGNLIH